ncbi:uncharacterized protein KZ484_026657 isoform 2-T2 [Pholidichthys leucotaenia]
MKGIYFQVLPLILLGVITECRGLVTVEATQGEDAALSCFNSTDPDPKSSDRFRWIKFSNTNRMEDVFKWPTGINNDGRVKLERDGNGKMYIFLKNVQKPDEGLYSCEMCQGWDCVLVKNISLKINDCKRLSSVKVGPGTYAQLNCQMNSIPGQQEPQNITWAMQKGKNKYVSVESEMNGISLIFEKVMTDNHGWYRCSYTLGQTTHCFEIKLSVQANVTLLTTRMEPSSKTVVAVVPSVILGVIIAAALVVLFIRHRRSKQRFTEQPQTQTAGSLSVYEGVLFSQDSVTDRVNSLYQNMDENMCTFHY